MILTKYCFVIFLQVTRVMQTPFVLLLPQFRHTLGMVISLELAPIQLQPQLIRPDADLSEPMIWPNPGNGTLQLDMKGLTEGEATMVLMTPEGSQMRTVTIEKGQRIGVMTGLDDLSGGLYYVIIQESGGQKWTLKWVKSE